MRDTGLWRVDRSPSVALRCRICMSGRLPAVSWPPALLPAASMHLRLHAFTVVSGACENKRRTSNGTEMARLSSLWRTGHPPTGHHPLPPHGVVLTVPWVQMSALTSLSSKTDWFWRQCPSQCLTRTDGRRSLTVWFSSMYSAAISTEYRGSFSVRSHIAPILRSFHRLSDSRCRDCSICVGIYPWRRSCVSTWTLCLDGKCPRSSTVTDCISCHGCIHIPRVQTSIRQSLTEKFCILRVHSR